MLIVIGEFRMVLISGYLFHPAVLPFIAGKWFGCYLGIQSGANLWLCVTHCCTLIHSG